MYKYNSKFGDKSSISSISICDLRYGKFNNAFTNFCEKIKILARPYVQNCTTVWKTAAL